ncbi:MAG: toll/interleukin-1 receptor domain-containing protein, partial [Chloroflexota bacterium]
MLDIFVSYSRRNLDFVERLTNDLEQASKKIWFDKKKEPLAGIPAGSRWWDEIKHGIETADNFLFVLGPQSIQSPYCNAEIAHALHHNKRIVTLLYCADASQAETLQAINSAINEIPADDQLPHTVSADIHSVRSLARRNWLELSQIQFVVYANVRDWNQWLQTVVDAVDLDIQWIRQWGQFQQAVQIWIESGYDDAYLWAEPRRKLI